MNIQMRVMEIMAGSLVSFHSSSERKKEDIGCPGQSKEELRMQSLESVIAWEEGRISGKSAALFSH